ncbi:MAG TPA: hydroxyphenylacetyl-CoA thioesterase PaaI [Steroidobacteraceae bacterium]|jgi:acyl-CoA thioesterase
MDSASPDGVGDQAKELAEATASFMYSQDSTSQALGMSLVEVRPGYAHLKMTVREDMVNGHRLCHGGMIFALADSAFAFACNSYNVVTVASGAQIEFLSPGNLGDELTAIAQERSRSRRNGIYDVTVSNQAGTSIALFRGRSRQFEGRFILHGAHPPGAASIRE